MSHSRNDLVLIWILRICAGIAATIILFIAIFLVNESIPALHRIGLSAFFTDKSWHPQEHLFNLLPMLWGTLAVALGAMIIATPLGILSAVFCHFVAPPAVAKTYRKLVELLAGIPSVVYGFWGLVVITPIIAHWQAPGASLFAATLVLALMVLPTIALLTDAALAHVPKSYVDSAAALGLSQHTTVVAVVLPAAKRGIVTALLLATGRAIGETMAVLMVAGNVVQIPTSIFDPIRTLTANIALEMAYAMDDHRAALFTSALILLIIVSLLVLTADSIEKHQTYA